MKKIIFLSILLLVLVYPLFSANTYRIGVLISSTGDLGGEYSSLTRSLLERFNSLEATPQRVEEIEFRLMQIETREKAKTVDKTLNGKKLEENTLLPLSSVKEQSFAIEFEYIQQSQEIINKALQNDTLILQHLAFLDNLDSILVISFSKIDTFDRFVVNWYSAYLHECNTVDDQLITDTNKKEIKKIILRSFMNLFDKSEYSLVSISSNTPSLSVNVDTVQYDNKDLLMFESGLKEFSFTAPYHKSMNKEIDLKKNEIIEFEINLEKEEFTPILISSALHISPTISTLGVVSLPYIYSSVSLPFIITQEQNGYTSKQIVVDSPLDSIDISLKREQFGYKNIVPEVQNAFYASLVRSVIVSGTSIIFASIFPKGEIDGIDTIHSFFNGVTLVSSIETIYRLFDYYEKTKYSTIK